MSTGTDDRTLDSSHPGSTTVRTARTWATITTAPLAVGAMSDWAVTPAAGALVTFTGVVRDHDGTTKDVSGIRYEAYAEVVPQLLTDIATEALARWPEVTRVALAHRHGEVGLSQTSVFVAASSEHRPDAFAVTRFCIDIIKSSLPIWKLEHSSSTSAWVQTGVDIESVAESARRWDQTAPAGDALGPIDVRALA